MLNIKGGDPTEYHEGDMADEIVEHDMQHMDMTELYEWARVAYEAEVKSWPTQTIRDRYNNMIGVPTP